MNSAARFSGVTERAMAAAYPGHAGIFGTPTEPLFNVKPMGMSASLLEEWLVVLAGENTTSMGVATCKQVTRLISH